MCALVLCVLWALLLCACGSDQESSTSRHDAINSTSPQFVVRLPDKNLLCFSIEGYELFTYNLITSNYLVLNGFVNLTTGRGGGEGRPSPQMRGFGDIGIIVKAVERRVKAGRRFFKHLIHGGKKKAIMEGFGEVDIKQGAITFSLMNGHSNIESQKSAHEQFRLILDKPKTNILLISHNGNTFNVYVEDCSGLVTIDMHGLIGEGLGSKFTHVAPHVCMKCLLVASRSVLQCQGSHQH